jgi:hypothetical protein
VGDDRSDETFRLFFLGAGFSRPAGLPLAGELLELVLSVARQHFRVDGFSHIESAVDRYRSYVADIDPEREFDIEEFGAWLDWEHTLELAGSDTFSDHGNEAGLQLRWAIGKVLHDRTPDELPQAYLDFASQLTTHDRVLTLNYDLVLEHALDAVGLSYRRFPGRFSEVFDTHATGDPDESSELVLSKLHGSLDWVYHGLRQEYDDQLRLQPLTEGPRDPDDPLLRIAVIPPDRLGHYYATTASWWRNPPILFPPSRAKPLAGSPLIPLWRGVGLYSYMLGGVTVIGCSLPAGDPYVVQLIHHIATDYAAGRRKQSVSWPQRRLKVVDLAPDEDAAARFRQRYRFMPEEDTDFLLDGFGPNTLESIFERMA